MQCALHHRLESVNHYGSATDGLGLTKSWINVRKVIVLQTFLRFWLSVADDRQIIIPAVSYHNPKSKHNITLNLTLTLTRNHTIYGIILTLYLTNLSRKHALVCCQSRNVNEPQLSRDYNCRPITMPNNTAGITIWRSSVTGIWDYTQCSKNKQAGTRAGSIYRNIGDISPISV